MKYVDKQQLTVEIDLHSIRITMEVNGYCQLFSHYFLQNNLFCVQQKIETHTGLEQVEGE